jgi:hypothetical protein
MPWLIADNGVRNPQRLKYGLEVLVNSEFHGDLSKRNEEGIANLLAQEGIISLQTNNDNTISRKWRINLIRLGFIFKSTHTVTENGRRLIHSRSLPEEEECFLRALLVHQLPSPLHNISEGNPKSPFNPLRMVLEVLSELEHRGLDATISKNEMASILILHYDMGESPLIVDEIIDYRNQRGQAIGNIKRFERSFRHNASINDGGRVSVNSLYDYADVNIRYLKLTGLFAEEGPSRLSIANHKRVIVNQILSEPFTPVPWNEYEEALSLGASLPTDNENEAIVAIRSLHALLLKHGEKIDELPSVLHTMNVQDLSQLRIRLENQWIHSLERQYAYEQQNQWEDIVNYMNALQQPNQIGRRGSIIPSGEGPAYLEWIIWRAFLAINSLKNEPWEARRFTIDRSFKPVRHASGGDADMIFEFSDFVFVVEVTLTTSSRQVAVEGEPVRRHVAQHVDRYTDLGKRVYGLFIANKIDTNTAETFRIGVWYRNDDSQMSLQIVPITLEDFSNIFEVLFRTGRKNEAKEYLKQLMNDLLSYSNSLAPVWKKQISEELGRRITLLEH